ncbi:uncharacterized protein V1513DRAFT_453564 [Lipomyces chichibuensis]|uniref:uncharacterized protein n=1 Tax=Lipomyces chichibuensis TaxID=1546026 RepID=UPI0033442E38
MSLLAYISNSHHYNYQNYPSPTLSLSACGGSPSNNSSSTSQSQHRHYQKGVHPIAKVLHREEVRRGSTSLVSSNSGSNSDRTLKFSIPQMAEELRYTGGGGHYEQQRVQQQQLHDPAGLGQFPENEEDISPTRLPSIQTLLTSAPTSASGVPAPSGSTSSSTSVTEGITRSSISSSTSSKSTSSAPAQLSPAMATITTTTTRRTPTPQSGYIVASGSTPQAHLERMPHTSAAVAAAAALQMPTTVYPQQQFIYPGPPQGMSAPHIHPPPLPHYMAAPQPYYMSSAQAPQGAYPPANPYAGLQPHPGLPPQYPPLRPMQLAPGMPLPIVSAGPGMPAAQTHLAPLKPKRKRATQQQVNRLNEVFQQTFFPSTEQRLELSRELGMTPRTVQIWFQNRRQGWRAESRRSSGGQDAQGHRLHQQQPGDLPGEGIDGEYDVSE